MAFLVIWLFLWDDELDDPTGSLIADLEGSRLYRLTTIQFVEQTLGLVDHQLVGGELHPFVSSFEPIGEILRQRYNVCMYNSQSMFGSQLTCAAQRRRFVAETEIFMKASEDEQHVKLNDEVWTLDAYWPYRLGTSAVAVCIAATE